MLIDFNQKLFNPFSGKAIPNSDQEDSTLSDVAVQALTSQIGNEVLDGATKFSYWELAKKINKVEVELKVEEVALIKERIGKLFPPIIVGLSYDLLES